MQSRDEKNILINNLWWLNEDENENEKINKILKAVQNVGFVKIILLKMMLK